MLLLYDFHAFRGLYRTYGLARSVFVSLHRQGSVGGGHGTLGKRQVAKVGLDLYGLAARLDGFNAEDVALQPGGRAGSPSVAQALAEAGADLMVVETMLGVVITLLVNGLLPTHHLPGEEKKAPPAEGPQKGE